MSGSRERSTSACVWVWPASCSANNSPVRRSPVIRSTFFNIHVWAVPGIGLTKAGLRGTEAVRYYFFIENFTINVLNPSQVYNICPTREIAERSSELPENLQYAKPSRRSVDRKSTRLNSSHVAISYAVFCLKKKKKNKNSDLI